MNKSIALHEIEADLAELETALWESGGEITPEMEERYGALLQMEAEKIEGYIRVIRRLELTAQAYKAEAQRLADNAKAAENGAKALKARLHYVMTLRGVKEYRTSVGRAYICNNGGKAPIEFLLESPWDAPERFRVTTVSWDTEALRGALEAGDKEAIGVAKIGERGTHLRIK